MPAGRPSKMTDIVVKKLEEAFAMGCDVSEACLFADISRKTYYEWINKNEELGNRFEALRENPFLIARKSVVTGLEKDHNLAYKYIREKKAHEFNGSEGTDNKIEVTISVIDEDKLGADKETKPSVEISTRQDD